MRSFSDVLRLLAVNLAICILLLSGAGICNAQHGNAQSHDNNVQVHQKNQAPVELEGITVTAEKMSEYIKNHPQDVTILEQEELQKRNIMGVEEALGVMPGVDVKRSSGIGARISIRGSGKSGGVLVLLNGRPLNTSQYGSVDLSTISIDTVKSITLFKPPVPVWLGSGGSEGAISIVTHNFVMSQKKSSNGSTKLKFSAGSYGLAEGSVSRQAKLKNGNIMATASANHKDGKRDNTDKNSGVFNLHWDREVTASTEIGTILLEATQLEADARFYTSEYGSAGPVDNPTPDARQKYEKGSVDTRVKGIIGETGDYTVNLYGDIIALNDESQSGAISDQDYIKVGIKPEANWSDDSDEWGLRLGAILEQENVDETLSGKHNRSSFGVSSQYDRSWNPVTATLGVRGDHTNDFGFNPGASTGVGLSITEKLLARINAGYSVNVPSFGQLYQSSHGSVDQTRGNPDLDPEKVFSYGVGLEYNSAKNQVVQLSVFRADTSDLISYQRGNDLIYRPINIDNAYRQGVELTVRQGWNNGIDADLSCIWQNSRNQDSRTELPYTPNGKIKTTVKYTVPELKTRLESTLRYESEQFSESENKIQEKLKSYTTMDIKITQPLPMLKLASEWYIEINNLWDTGFQIHYGYPDDGVRFSSGINIMF